jgi:hypothetical protein
MNTMPKLIPESIRTMQQIKPEDVCINDANIIKLDTTAEAQIHQKLEKSRLRQLQTNKSNTAASQGSEGSANHKGT